MYDEDRIFGPLTFKQFLCAAMGALAIYWAKSNLLPPVLYGIYVIIVVMTILGILRFKPKKISIDNLENYLKNKRAGLTDKDYLKILKRHRAQVQSQIFMRMEKGLNNNDDLVKAESILGRLINELPQI